jgi:hypothetical protein
MEKKEQGQPKETSGETSRKTLTPDNRQREQATRSQSKGREGRGSNSGMQKSNSAEKNQPKRKRTARQLKQEQHGTNALLRAWRGRTGGQKKDSKRTRGGRVRGGEGGRSVPAFMDPLAKRGRCTQLYTSTKPKDGYHWITSEGMNKTKSCPRFS